jgi:hypothetical protein
MQRRHAAALRPSKRLTRICAEAEVRGPQYASHRAVGPGERIVFEPYTEEVFNRSREWIAQHEIFGAGGLGTGTYEQVIARGI